MSDSGRVLGDCRHGRSRDNCVECLEAEAARLRSGLAEAMKLLVAGKGHLNAAIEQSQSWKNLCERWQELAESRQAGLDVKAAEVSRLRVLRELAESRLATLRQMLASALAAASRPRGG